MQGFLLLNKPANITSYGAVARIKRLSGEKRVGHTGTLDPMATGVLPVFLGRATALSSYLIDADKEYRAKIKLGVLTDTGDITGNIIRQVTPCVTNAELLDALNSFKGDIMQTPPVFSAIKKDGIRLYELARKGVEVEVPERQVTVHSIELLSEQDCENIFEISVRVSKGTYIRSLAVDIGKKLLCGATLAALKRTETGGFSVNDCVNLEDLTQENFEEHLQSEEKAVEYIPKLYVTKPQAVRFTNGGQLAFERLKHKEFIPNQLYRIKYEDKFLGIGYADCENNQIAIKCVINKF